MTNDHLIITHALEIFYLWVVFAPLSRGSAVCGYAVLYSIVLTFDRIINKKIPKNKQLDWEAILAKNCVEFIENVKNWFLPLQSFVVVDEKIENVLCFNDKNIYYNNNSNKNNVSNDNDNNKDENNNEDYSDLTFQNIEEMIEILNLPYDNI
jgi:hypothetical protein